MFTITLINACGERQLIGLTDNLGEARDFMLLWCDHFDSKGLEVKLFDEITAAILNRGGHPVYVITIDIGE